MTTRVLGSALLVLLLTVPAIAWNEPDAFRGVPWGASEEVLKAQIPSTCSVPVAGSTFFGEWVCSSAFTVGDGP